jgi:hypothetical protein
MRRAPHRTVAFVVTAAAALGLLPLSASSAAQLAPAAGSSCRTGVITPSPSPGPYVGLFGVSALSSQDVWSVGYYIKTGQSSWRTLIEHWNGKRWTVVRSPRPAPNAILYDVTAVAPSDVWAVGLRANSSRLDQIPLIEHWNGTAWSLVASPRVPGVLGDMAVASPGDIWASGFRQVAGGTRPATTLVEHWNGTSWQLVPTPNPSKYGDVLGGISVAGPNDVWATGQAGTSRYDTAPLAEHWDGHAWSVVQVPAEGFSSTLGAVASAGPDDVWSVGSYDEPSPTGTLIAGTGTAGRSWPAPARPVTTTWPAWPRCPHTTSGQSAAQQPTPRSCCGGTDTPGPPSPRSPGPVRSMACSRSRHPRQPTSGPQEAATRPWSSTCAHPAATDRPASRRQASTPGYRHACPPIDPR